MATSNASTRTIILIVVLVPVIIYLLNFAYKKNKESSERAQACYQSCIDEGYEGYDFQWQMLSGPQCQCLGEQKDPFS